LLLLIPVRGHDVYSLINRETLLELRSKLRSDALHATIINFFFWDPNPWLAEYNSCILSHYWRNKEDWEACTSPKLFLGIVRMSFMTGSGLTVSIYWTEAENTYARAFWFLMRVLWLASNIIDSWSRLIQERSLDVMTNENCVTPYCFEPRLTKIFI